MYVIKFGLGIVGVSDGIHNHQTQFVPAQLSTYLDSASASQAEAQRSPAPFT